MGTTSIGKFRLPAKMTCNSSVIIFRQKQKSHRDTDEVFTNVPQEALNRRRRWLEDMTERIHSGEEDARLSALSAHVDSSRASRTSQSSPLNESESNTTATGPPQRRMKPLDHTRRKRSNFSHLGSQFDEVRDVL